ncbi:MAG: hypothetical protein AAGK09_05490 [Planctomycetota bacterium]
MAGLETAVDVVGLYLESDSGQFKITPRQITLIYASNVVFEGLSRAGAGGAFSCSADAMRRQISTADQQALQQARRFMDEGRSDLAMAVHASRPLDALWERILVNSVSDSALHGVIEALGDFL